MKATAKIFIMAIFLIPLIGMSCAEEPDSNTKFSSDRRENYQSEVGDRFNECFRSIAEGGRPSGKYYNDDLPYFMDLRKSNDVFSSEQRVFSARYNISIDSSMRRFRVIIYSPLKSIVRLEDISSEWIKNGWITESDDCYGFDECYNDNMNTSEHYQAMFIFNSKNNIFIGFDIVNDIKKENPRIFKKACQCIKQAIQKK